MWGCKFVVALSRACMYMYGPRHVYVHGHVCVCAGCIGRIGRIGPSPSSLPTREAAELPAACIHRLAQWMAQCLTASNSPTRPSAPLRCVGESCRDALSCLLLTFSTLATAAAAKSSTSTFHPFKRLVPSCLFSSGGICRSPALCQQCKVAHCWSSSCCTAAASAPPRRGKGRVDMPNDAHARPGGHQQVEDGGRGLGLNAAHHARRSTHTRQ